MHAAPARFVEDLQEQAGDKRSDDHDAFQRDVHNAASLGEHAAQRDQQQGNGKENGGA
ncbi:hypothetical protein SDC9_75088 [bioreactor metagenome]|uniref:Uncharacterized protein n=1 Tax=bioreactor metagenome TaxID=1076179 RepID=A0A644YIU9_9ZZZZ